METALETIYVVDDDESLRKSFIKRLTAEGYRVQSAGSGEAGLDLVQ